MTKKAPVGDPHKGGRRGGDRRVAEVATSHDDRRKAERRSGRDRRASPRHVAT